MSIFEKTVLVTGASSGIGYATAEGLIKEGARVIGLCRDVSKLPEGVQPLSCDLTDEHAINSAFAQISHLDVIINNAGMALLSRISDGESADWEKMWKLNVQALSICSQKALTLFPDGEGQIINVSSMSGHRVPPSGGFYAATKFAVRAVTDALRSELRADGSRTRVATVSPGFVDTPLLDTYFQGREQQLEHTRSSMKMLSPSDVAASIMHILNTPLHLEITDIQLRSADQVG
ncbi:MAG: SDR family oxidoreductase [Akkermansiaceae bacterium]